MLYVVLDLAQRSSWHEYFCRYALALLKAGVPLRVLPYGRDVVEGTSVPQEFEPLLDTMLGNVEPCTSMLYIGEPAGAVELVSRGPAEVPDEKYVLTTWPTDSMPAGLVAGLNCYDNVIVPTEAVKQVLLRSGVVHVDVLLPPDPPTFSGVSPIVPPHPMLLAMGSWGGLDNVRDVLHAYATEFRRADGYMLHLVCPDIPFDNAAGLEWECANVDPAEMPLISLAKEPLDGPGRAALFGACRVFASASRRMDLDPYVREAVLRGRQVAAPSAAAESGLPDEFLWTVASVPCGAEECSLRGVGFDQMWGDVDAADLGTEMRAALGSAYSAAVKTRGLESTGKQLEKLLVRTAADAIAPGEVALRVVVPHKNRGLKFVQPCLDALLPQLGLTDTAYLVDQESAQDVSDEVLVFCINRGVSVLPSEPGPGGAWSLAAARNVGAQFKDGPGSTHVFFLDCDCVIPDGFISALKEKLKENPAAIMIPRVRGSETRQERAATGLAAMSLKLYADVGGYDEGYYGWGSEDVDLLWRARRRFGADGSVLPEEEMVITHLDHEPCDGREDHGNRNEQRFMAMAGGGHS